MTTFKLALIASTAVLAAACSSPEAESTPNAGSAAMSHGDTGHGAMEQNEMDHSTMDHGAMAAAEATGRGVLNAIDAENSVVNITHPAMPEIGWPEMTMDLPATRAVDLSELSPGDQVTFTVRRGRDDQFRIVAMSTVADE